MDSKFTVVFVNFGSGNSNHPISPKADRGVSTASGQRGGGLKHHPVVRCLSPPSGLQSACDRSLGLTFLTGDRSLRLSVMLDGVGGIPREAPGVSGGAAKRRTMVCENQRLSTIALC